MDPDPAFYLNPYPDTYPKSIEFGFNADPDLD
jgi:hypothetical protein